MHVNHVLQEHLAFFNLFRLKKFLVKHGTITIIIKEKKIFKKNYFFFKQTLVIQKLKIVKVEIKWVLFLKFFFYI